MSWNQQQNYFLLIPQIIFLQRWNTSQEIQVQKALEMYCSWFVMFDLLETNSIGNHLIPIYENLKQTLFGPNTTKYVFT